MTELHSFNLLDNDEGYTDKDKVPCKACGELIAKGRVWCDEYCYTLDNCEAKDEG